MTLPIGSRVQVYKSFGVVREVMASGRIYRVEFPDIGSAICFEAAVNPAPLNVIPFVRNTSLEAYPS